MFGKEKLEKEIDSLNRSLEHYKGLAQNRELELEEIRTRAKLENELAEKRQSLAVSKATDILKKENRELVIENGILKKEVEILRKAFENMGFDVKDMKDILNKLVDGIVDKNKVQLIK